MMLSVCPECRRPVRSYIGTDSRYKDEARGELETFPVIIVDEHRRLLKRCPGSGQQKGR